MIERLLDLASNVRREDAPGLGICPYKGLNYFDEADADLFVGREALTSKLTERLLSLAGSGSLYSSRFPRCGRRFGQRQIVTRPRGIGSRPALGQSLRRLGHSNPHAHRASARELGGELHRRRKSFRLQKPCSRLTSLSRFAKKETHLLLVVDQFEEVFALCRSEEERGSFISNLLDSGVGSDGSMSSSSSPCGRTFTLIARITFHCVKHSPKNQEYIGTMNDDELRRAIEEPAHRGRWEFEPGLVDLLLHDVGHEPGALPLLSHALLETWQRRRGTGDDPQRICLLGRGARRNRRNGRICFHRSIHTGTTRHRPPHFLRLTELGDETAQATRAAVLDFNELILKPEETAVTRKCLKALADARLIITSEDPQKWRTKH